MRSCHSSAAAVVNMDISKNNAQKSRPYNKRNNQEKDGRKKKDPRQTPTLNPKR
jgi:hypothetical protein